MLFRAVENYDDRHCTDGRNKWPRPTIDKPGRRTRAIANPIIGVRGYELFTFSEVFNHPLPNLYVAEGFGEGQASHEGTVIAFEQARLVKRVEQWYNRTLEDFACKCALHALEPYNIGDEVLKFFGEIKYAFHTPLPREMEEYYHDSLNAVRRVSLLPKNVDALSKLLTQCMILGLSCGSTSCRWYYRVIKDIMRLSTDCVVNAVSSGISDFHVVTKDPFEVRFHETLWQFRTLATLVGLVPTIVGEEVVLQ